jgi:hypothetical protein
VNGLSCKKYHVKNGKVTYESPNMRNLGPQISFISEYAILTPYQKHKDAGIE